MSAVLQEAVAKGKLTGKVAGSTSETAQKTSQSKSAIGVSGSVAVNVVDDDARAYILNTGAFTVTAATEHFNGTDIDNSGTLTVKALNSTSVGSLAGAAAFAKGSGSGSSTGIAGALGVDVLTGVTDAFIDG